MKSWFFWNSFIFVLTERTSIHALGHNFFLQDFFISVSPFKFPLCGCLFLHLLKCRNQLFLWNNPSRFVGWRNKSLTGTYARKSEIYTANKKLWGYTSTCKYITECLWMSLIQFLYRITRRTKVLTALEEGLLVPRCSWHYMGNIQ